MVLLAFSIGIVLADAIFVALLGSRIKKPA